MGNLIELDDMRPHISGPVICARCGHGYVAVRPAGVDSLECVKCGAKRARDAWGHLNAFADDLGDECCGQVDCDGICVAPACVRGEALKLAQTIKAALIADEYLPLETPND